VVEFGVYRSDTGKQHSAVRFRRGRECGSLMMSGDVLREMKLLTSWSRAAGDELDPNWSRGMSNQEEALGVICFCTKP
jgi:hypothetical protein